ncbi:MAG: GNAT family N-acetyltransferase [Bacteroidales bacterium]|nr:GNAT family N-acetyltransferase [Bacteroidales bacterium]MCM1414930.1 GNAT family N-acetyltransferase [bacterium]MCM1423078.1 GNAT family N-acetyltransferase [bacterium]
METPYEIRSAYRDEWEDAMALAWRTFLRFEAKDYTPEGVANFERFVTDETLHRMFIIGSYHLFVAREDGKLIGMITLRSDSHISLLFVDEKYHRRGIGRALVQCVKSDSVSAAHASRITVNASPYGVEFYHKLGFRDIRPQEQRDGIIYTPMELIL